MRAVAAQTDPDWAALREAGGADGVTRPTRQAWQLMTETVN